MKARIAGVGCPQGGVRVPGFDYGGTPRPHKIKKHRCPKCGRRLILKEKFGFNDEFYGHEWPQHKTRSVFRSTAT